MPEGPLRGGRPHEPPPTCAPADASSESGRTRPRRPASSPPPTRSPGWRQTPCPRSPAPGGSGQAPSCSSSLRRPAGRRALLLRPETRDPWRRKTSVGDPTPTIVPWPQAAARAEIAGAPGPDAATRAPPPSSSRQERCGAGAPGDGANERTGGGHPAPRPAGQAPCIHSQTCSFPAPCASFSPAGATSAMCIRIRRAGAPRCAPRSLTGRFTRSSAACPRPRRRWPESWLTPDCMAISRRCRAPERWMAASP